MIMRNSIAKQTLHPMSPGLYVGCGSKSINKGKERADTYGILLPKYLRSTHASDTVAGGIIVISLLNIY